MKKLIIALLFTLAFNIPANAELLEADDWLDCGYNELESNNGTFELKNTWYWIGGGYWSAFSLWENGNGVQWSTIDDGDTDAAYGDHVDQWENPDDHDNCFLLMQGDGNLVFYGDNGYGQPVWQSGTDGNDGAYLNIQNDGNMVIYDENDQPLWSIR